MLSFNSIFSEELLEINSDVAIHYIEVEENGTAVPTYFEVIEFLQTPSHSRCLVNGTLQSSEPNNDGGTNRVCIKSSDCCLYSVFHAQVSQLN